MLIEAVALTGLEITANSKILDASRRVLSVSLRFGWMN
jgi:hypothetical protein